MINDKRYNRQRRLEIIKEIKKRRKAGATYREIEEEFNDEGIKTMTGKGKWHFQNIQRLAKG